MTIENYKNKVKTSIWKAVAQSGFQINAIPSDQQAKFVDQLTDDLLLLVNDMLEDISSPINTSKMAQDLDKEEKILWEGRPFLSLVENYTFTNERIKVIKGLIGKDIENFELIRVQDIDITQNVSERILGIGDIVVSGADKSTPTIILRNIKDPESVYEILRKAWLNARKKYGLIFREEL